MWPEIRETFRRLRRAEDEFVYEPVVVGSFEDAVLAVVFNPNLQAVVISDGFGFPSQYTVPRAARDPASARCKWPSLRGAAISGTLLGADGAPVAAGARRLPDDRPRRRALAGSAEAAPIRRIFYGVEEPMEIHLAILDGVKDRYETPYFDNLKHYAQRPIGTFHALPVARGKSIFKSNWIRDMGEFYGANLFLAESSATTGGLDSLLEPTGNIKVAQDKAARALGGDRSFFVTNGTSTSNKIVHQALLTPGRHRPHRPRLPQVAPLRARAGRRPAALHRRVPAHAVLDVRQPAPSSRSRRRCSQLKAEGKLDRAKMVVLTNCTFDGHVANVEAHDAGVPRDQAGPRLPLGRGVVRLRALLAVPAPPHRDGRGGGAPRADARSGVPEALRGVQGAAPASWIRRTRSSSTLQLLPDPDKVRVRVYETDSVHKSMSSLRQGSIIVVADQDFHTVEASFKEAFFTHTSTSPNLQIIASLDVARRQMELEGYELVGRAIQLAIEARREINGHPLISKYFRVATPAEMIPAEYRKSGFTDWGAPGWTMSRHDGGAATTTSSTSTRRGSRFSAAPPATTARSSRRILASEHDIQINKTSRNSVLVQININNTRSDLAHLIKALADMARAIEKRLAEGGVDERAAFTARVKSLVEDVPDLPNFQRFHDAFRDDPKSATPGRHMRDAYYMAYDAANSSTSSSTSKEIDERLRQGPGARLGEVRDPVPAGLPDHGARPGRHEGDHRVHAQARREGDPRLRRGEGTRALEARGAGQAPDARPRAATSRTVMRRAYTSRIRGDQTAPSRKAVRSPKARKGT